MKYAVGYGKTKQYTLDNDNYLLLMKTIVLEYEISTDEKYRKSH